MSGTDKDLIIRIGNIFIKHKDRILHKWLSIIKRNNLITDETELDLIKYSFEALLHEFGQSLAKGNIKNYYAKNKIIAEKIAINDISYSKFIKIFHLFEDSYGDVLKEEVELENLFKYLSLIDKLHHNTIAILSEAYFAIKDDTVFILAKMAEMREKSIGFHLERTREYSFLLAKKLNLDQNFVDLIYRVGPLHDIGKVAIRDNILLKSDRLTPEEYEEVQKHTTIGADFISQIIGNKEVSRGYLKMAKDIILYHHEKFDGSGYPEKLKGEQIPMAARIFALADAYDVIVTARPYKEPLPHDEAIRRIKNDSGSHFEPRIVEIFLELNEEFNKIRKYYENK